MQTNTATVLRTESTDENLPWKLVGHENPDTDAWACLWAADRFIVPKEAERNMAFVRSGTQLSEEEMAGFHVLHMDTGGGEFDQHGKNLPRASSFKLLLERYGLTEDPGMVPILELTIKADNVEEIPFDSVHHYFKGLPFNLRDPESREVLWSQIWIRVAEVFDVIYAQAQHRAKTRKDFKDKNAVVELRNGIKVALIYGHPGFRNAAFEEGADVVLWTAYKKGGKFEVGIQSGRGSSVKLKGVAAGLRRAEAKARGVDVVGDLTMFGEDPLGSKWFFHDSGNLVVCGSRSHPLQGDEYTHLKQSEIGTIVKEMLALAPRPR